MSNEKKLAPEIEAAAIIAVGNIVKASIMKCENSPDGNRVMDIFEISVKPFLRAGLIEPRPGWLEEIHINDPRLSL